MDRALGPVEVSWSRGLRAVYDRASDLPGAWAQMGAGGLLYAGRDTAASLAIQTRLRAASRVEPFPGMRVNLGYEQARNDGAGARSERSVTDRKWPDVEVTWSGFPASRITRGAVRSLALSGGFTRQAREGADAASQDRTTRTETRLPLGANLAMRGGLTLSYRGDWRLGGDETVLTRTRSGDRVQTLTANGPIRLPELLQAGDRRVGLTLTYTQSDRHECRMAAETTGCGADNQFLRVQDRMLRFQADTRIRDLSVGLHGDYVSRASLIGQREGSSNFRVGVFAQFELVSRPTGTAASAVPPP